MTAQIGLTCRTCDVMFWRPLRTAKSRDRAGMKNTYCSRACYENRNKKINPSKQTGPEMVGLICGHCRQHFQRSAASQKERYRMGSRATYCTNECSVAAHRDKYSPFRMALLRAKHSKHAETGFDLTLEYLRDLWHQQDGKCVLTGWEIVLPNSTYDYYVTDKWANRGYRNASLDRIDSSGGYTMGNVRWVALIVNVMRSNYSDAQLLQTCQAILDHAQAMRV